MGSLDTASIKLINLQLGWPSPRLFAANGLLDGARDILTSEVETSAALVYGPHMGYTPLRKSIAQWLSTVYSVGVNYDRICVSNGASANLSNVLQKFTDPIFTRKIFMVEPTYFLACPIFEDNGFQGKLRGVPECEDGVDLDFLARELEAAEQAATENANTTQMPDIPTIKTGPAYPRIYKHIIYTVPTFSNPSGKTMSIDTRRQLVHLARKYDALIVSDDVYDFLSWFADPSIVSRKPPAVPPRLVDLDQKMNGYDTWGHTVSNGSFSKIIGPGVRVGWADGSPAFVKALGEVGSSSSGGAPSHLTSTFVDRMLRSGSLQAHISTVLVPEYRSRFHALDTAIDELLVPLGVRVESNEANGVVGGFFTYLRLPSDLPTAKTVAAIALTEKQLRVAFGHMFAVTGDDQSLVRGADANGFSACLRLCWAWHEVFELEEGVARLADAIQLTRAKMTAGDSFDEYTKIGIR